jgi:hypothetical protein
LWVLVISVLLFTLTVGNLSATGLLP